MCSQFSRKFHDRWSAKSFDQLLNELVKLPTFQVCFEASTGYGRFYELLKTVAARVAVAHPGLLKLIWKSKKKNDRADALKLARLLYIDQVPEVHVPSADVRTSPTKAAGGSVVSASRMGVTALSLMARRFGG